MLQQSPTKANDAIDLLIESVQQVTERIDENGQKQITIEPDNESLWMKTQLVNSPFAGFILKLRFLRDLADAAKYNMCEARAKVIQSQILDIYKSYKYSIDAKSSETLRDKNNSQSSLFHIVTQNKMERAVTLKGEMSKSLGASIMGREAQREEQY